MRVSTDDISYYRQRANQERAMALQAERANVAAIHEELARQYQALVDSEELRAGSRLEVSTRLWA